MWSNIANIANVISILSAIASLVFFLLIKNIHSKIKNNNYIHKLIQFQNYIIEVRGVYNKIRRSHFSTVIRGINDQSMIDDHLQIDRLTNRAKILLPTKFATLLSITEKLSGHISDIINDKSFLVESSHFINLGIDLDSLENGLKLEKERYDLI